MRHMKHKTNGRIIVRPHLFGDCMTNSELIEKLNQAQQLLSDVYHWADESVDGELKVNDHVARLMSAADDHIWESIHELKKL